MPCKVAFVVSDNSCCWHEANELTQGHDLHPERSVHALDLDCLSAFPNPPARGKGGLDLKHVGSHKEVQLHVLRCEDGVPFKEQICKPIKARLAQLRTVSPDLRKLGVHLWCKKGRHRSYSCALMVGGDLEVYRPRR